MQTLRHLLVVAYNLIVLLQFNFLLKYSHQKEGYLTSVKCIIWVRVKLCLLITLGFYEGTRLKYYEKEIFKDKMYCNQIFHVYNCVKMGAKLGIPSLKISTNFPTSRVVNDMWKGRYMWSIDLKNIFQVNFECKSIVVSAKVL